MTNEIQRGDSLEAATSATTRPQPTLRKVFIGPRGLRAGWKVLIFVLIFFAGVLCLQPLGRLLGQINPKAPPPPGAALLHEFLGMAAVLIATAIMAKFIDHKPWGYFGTPLQNAFRSNFWIGAAVGLGTLALQLEIMHFCGWFDYGTQQLHGAAIVAYGGLWALMFLCVGVTEEGVLRGYVQRVTTDGLSRLPGGWSFWTSALLFSIVFAGGHISNPGENRFGIIMVLIDGMVMCFSLWRTGDLWFAIGNHAAWDWGETFLFGTPNSGFRGQDVLMNPSFHGPLLLAGGTDGPEGSVLVLLSEALVVLLIAFIYHRRRFPLITDHIPAEQGDLQVTYAPPDPATRN
ncbi:MAG TPA: type II CAAX endopeptidase family protein [Terriglobales bacterium]|nr:type II CAAX endopeptidase family protein [Terriglobales bacterium]